MVSYKAGSIGSGSNTVRETFEEKYVEDMDKDAAVLLGLEALQKASEEPLQADTIEVGLVVAGERFARLSSEEVQARLGQLET